MSLGNPEPRVDGFPRGHQLIQVSARAAQHIAQNLRGRKIRAAAARHAPGDKRQQIRKVAVQNNGLGLYGLKVDFGVRRQISLGDLAVKFLHLRKHGVGLHVTRNHQDGIVRGVPTLVEAAQHLSGGRIERFFGPQGIMAVRSSREHVLIQAGDEFVSGVGKIARHFLFDRALLAGPFFLRILNVLHAVRVHTQCDIHVGRRHGRKILGNILLRIGISVTAQLRENRGDLIRGHVRAPAKGHVFLGMGHTRKFRRGFVATHQEIFFNGYHGRQGIAYDHHT